MSQQPISIIGAGLGGVTLGRCLSKHGIKAVLYEKATSLPRNSYGITLHQSTYQPLLKLLDIDEATFRKRVAVDGPLGGTGAVDPNKLVCPGEVQRNSFRANRESLETLLRESLDVRWEHALDKIETAATGATLRLQNGDKIERACVVGADGVHATTRKSLLPDVELNVLPFVAIYRIHRRGLQATGSSKR